MITCIPKNTIAAFKVNEFLLLSIFVVAILLFQSNTINQITSAAVIIATGILLLTKLMYLHIRHHTLTNIAQYLGQLSYPLYITHAVAGRIADFVHFNGCPAWLAYSTSIIAIAMIATYCNERFIRLIPVRLPTKISNSITVK